MSDICRWPALKLKMAIRLRQKTTTSTLSITSDRCSRALTRTSCPFAGRLHHRSKRKRASGRLIADYEARLGFVSGGKRRSITGRPRVARTGPLTMWRPHPAQGYCLTFREEMAATAAIIMLAPINASSRTMSGGIPMSSRAISASNSAVATAAVNPRITSTVRFMW